jgi:hypothetical protein
MTKRIAKKPPERRRGRPKEAGTATESDSYMGIVIANPPFRPRGTTVARIRKAVAAAVRKEA